jgi:hypothetical protein
MDDTKPTRAPTSTGRDRRAGTIQSVAGLASAIVLVFAFLLLPVILSIVRGDVREIAAMALWMALAFLALLATTLACELTETFEPIESARRRGAEQRVFGDLRPIVRPVLHLFSWWHPFRLGRFGEAVLLPDSMANFCVAMTWVVAASGAMALVWLSMLTGQPLSLLWLYLALLGLGMPAVLVSPFLLTAVLWVSHEDVRLVRFFAVIPYWVHRLPRDAEFTRDLDYPVGFTSRSRRGYDLQLGTPTSASPLYHHISQVLERAGWKPAPPGYLPRMSRIPSAVRDS